jgi:pyruvate dehydrogenase E1 component beta subunit
MSSKNRKISYSLAINEALRQMMAADRSVFLIGQGVKSPWYVSNTTKGLLARFGPERVVDTPVSENAITGAAVGAALSGMRPVVVHPRMDFMLYAFDPIINEAANWHYMCGGKLSVPMVIWGIINRGGEQAAQHSQALQALFAHIPGLKVVMPSNPYDAKGLLVSAIRDDNPVIFIDDRWLYNSEGPVPQKIYAVPLGKGKIKRSGSDLTVVATSFMVSLALQAAKTLEIEGIDLEVIDPRTMKPLDEDLIFKSVRKTGKLLVIDAAWKTCGLAAEISCLVAENIFKYLRAPIRRITLPDSPAPASRTLEKSFYPRENDIIKAVKELVRQ